MDVGLGLWTMQSTAAAPASHAGLYRRLQSDARLAEELGFHSLWVAEHHFWYDGWCPQPLVAAAAALGATSRLRVGTGVQVLPLQEPEPLIATAGAVHALSGGRLELGVGIGYRDIEFEGVGLRRQTRGRRADAALDAMASAWGDGGPPLWIGGTGEFAERRAATRGLAQLLPPTVRAVKVPEIVERTRRQALDAGHRPGRVGQVLNAWVTDGSEDAREWYLGQIAAQHREWAGAWWWVDGTLGFQAAPERLERVLERRVLQTAIVGSAAQVAGALRALAGAGVDLVVLQVSADVTRDRYADAMRRLAEDVVPALTEVAA